MGAPVRADRAGGRQEGLRQDPAAEEAPFGLAGRGSREGAAPGLAERRELDAAAKESGPGDDMRGQSAPRFIS